MSDDDLRRALAPVNKEARRSGYILLLAAVCLAGALVLAFLLYGALRSTDEKVDALSQALDEQRAQFLDCQKEPPGPKCDRPVAPPAKEIAPPGEVRLIPGPQGPEGPRGPEGNEGPPGPPGDDGTPGASGPPGKSGEPGTRGPAGSTGAAGDDGSTGPAGDQGPAGPAGPQGPAGPPGATGERGPQGPEGQRGPAGEDGQSAFPFTFTFSVPTLTGNREVTCTINSPTDYVCN